MPQRITGKRITTLGELRKFINDDLSDLDDDYKLTIDDSPIYSIRLLADCDISYSSKSLSIDCDIDEHIPSTPIRDLSW